MFGRLKTARVKAAEKALREGRLDEAFDALTGISDPTDRRLEAVGARLAECLLERGQDRMMNQRFSEALADFDRAGRLGHFAERVAAWRDRALKAVQEGRLAATDRAEALAEARQRLADGSLHGAAAALAGVPAGDADRAAVTEAIEGRAAEARRAVETARAVLGKGNLRGAVEAVRRAAGLHGKLEGLESVRREVVERVVREAGELFSRGRPDRAAELVAVLDGCGWSDAGLVELREAVRLVAEAVAALRADRYAEAGVPLGRLATVRPGVVWVDTARECLRGLEERRRTLMEGPLGMVLVPGLAGERLRETASRGDAVPRVAPPVIGRMAREQPQWHGGGGAVVGAAGREAAAGRQIALGQQVPAIREAASGNAVSADGAGIMPAKLLLRIDGVGSFLLLRRERIAIGRAGAGATADLQLVSDLAERQAEIVRAGDDYFLMAQSGVELAGRPVDYALLADGDRISLGRRVRLTFRRPSLKSNTAVLELGDGVRTTTDCRRVLLWSGPILIGSTKECHIARPDSGVMVLSERRGEMFVRGLASGECERRLALGEAMEVCGVTMRLVASQS